MTTGLGQKPGMVQAPKKKDRSAWGAFKRFAQQYRRSIQGRVGLFLLTIVVFAAVFAPWITRFDPLNDLYLAQNMARPAWMGYFPKYRETSRTVHRFLFGNEWKLVESGEYEFGQHFQTSHSEDSYVLSWVGGEGKVVFEDTFTYAAEPPGTFTILFKYGVEAPSTVTTVGRLFMVDPTGKESLLWTSPTIRGSRNYGQARVDSRDMALKTRLGISPFADLNQSLFKEHGTYTVRLQVTQTGNANGAPVNFFLGETHVGILGRLHGVLGADHLGGDLWSQLVYGTRISLLIGILAAFIAVAIGTTIGIISGYLGGVVDEVLMRVADVMLSIPTLPILIILSSILGKSVYNVIILVSIFSWMGTSRIVRSQTLTLKERAFVEAARASGAKDGYVMLVHILPNVIPMVFAALVLLIPSAVLYEASLSFLGLGDPLTPTWGRMLNNARSFGAFTELAWWWIVPPGLAITVLSLAFVFVGNTLDEILNPRNRERS